MKTTKEIQAKYSEIGAELAGRLHEDDRLLNETQLYIIEWALAYKRDFKKRHKDIMAENILFLKDNAESFAREHEIKKAENQTIEWLTSK